MEEKIDFEIMDRFSNIVDVFSNEGDIQESVTSKIKSVWKKFMVFWIFCAKKAFYLESRNLCTNALAISLSAMEQTVADKLENERKKTKWEYCLFKKDKELEDPWEKQMK